MVFVWSHLTDGDANYTLVQVSVNDIILVFAFAPIAGLLLGDPSWTWRAAEVGPIDAGADAPDAPSDTGVPLDGAPVPVQDAGDAAATRSPDAAASGCGCRSVPAASGGGWGVLLVLGLLLGRHYRRCFVGRR
jgi:MYXO-CTERM domain-containing protein